METHLLDRDKVIANCVADSENDPFIPICGTKLKDYCQLLNEEISAQQKACKQNYLALIALEVARCEQMLVSVDEIERTLVLGNTTANPLEAIRATFVALDRIRRLEERIKESIEYGEHILEEDDRE